jgi:ADP-ribose pyrophosphatase YjhB (NUDIX family)
MCVILVGYTSDNPTSVHPLPLRSRKAMIEQWLFNEQWHNRTDITVVVGELKDIPFSDELWSKSLDDTVDMHKRMTLVPDTTDITLMGGRDSFNKYYSGKFKFSEIESLPNVSATKIRKYPPTPSTTEQAKWFRAGQVAAQTFKPYGNIYPTVDAIVTKRKNGVSYILMGRKHGEKQWRLPGGHVDLSDKSFEDAVVREVYEETGLDFEHLEYPTYFETRKLNDRRYRGSKDAVFTTVFILKWCQGNIKAGDDLEEVAWISLHKLRAGTLEILDDHKQIIKNYVEQ